MGGIQSTPSSSSNPSPTTATMPSSNTPTAHDSKPQSEPTHEPTSPNPGGGVQESSDQLLPLEKSQNSREDGGGAPEGAAAEEGGEGEEEEGECGFCLFMKAGGCKDEFIAWEKCVEEGDKNGEDIADKCFELTSILKKCMEAHPEHYGPLLEAEKAAHEQARKEFEEEKEKEIAGESATVAEASGQKNEAKDSVLSPPEKRQEAS